MIRAEWILMASKAYEQNHYSPQGILWLQYEYGDLSPKMAAAQAALEESTSEPR